MESYSIGRVFSRAFTLARGTLGSVGLLLFVVHVVSMAIQWFFQRSMMASVTAADPKDPLAALSIFSSGWYWALMLVSIVMSGVSFAGSIHGMLKFADTGQSSFADCLSAGFAKFLPLVGLMILWYLALIPAFILLFIPGLILSTMWSAAIPALVGENLGVFASFGRSRELTRGMRLSIFGTWFLVMVVFYIVVFGVILSLLGTNLSQFAMPTNQTPLLMAVMVPVGMLLGLAMNALLTSVYLETVLVKEGGRSAHLVDVFD